MAHRDENIYNLAFTENVCKSRAKAIAGFAEGYPSVLRPSCFCNKSKSNPKTDVGPSPGKRHTPLGLTLNPWEAAGHGIQVMSTISLIK